MFLRRIFFSILTRYCLREIAVPAVLAVAVIGFVGVANELRERRDDLPLQFISGWDMARLIVYFSPTLIAYLVPIAFMMGILLAFGRMAQHNEITAMKAAGIPLKRLVLPVVFVGALLSIGTFFLQNRVQPRAIDRANRLLYSELPQRVTLDVLPAGVMNDFGGVRVSFRSRDLATKTLNDIVVVQPKSGPDWIFFAKSAQFVETPRGTELVLRDGHQVMPRKNDEVAAPLFTEQRLALESRALRPAPAQHRSMTLGQLLEREKKSAERYKLYRNKQNAEDVRTVRAEISERITLPLACLAVSLAAAPLAVRAPRSGRSFAFAIGVALLGGYYLMRVLLEVKSVRPLDDHIVRGLVPNLVLGIVGLWGLWRVDRV